MAYGLEMFVELLFDLHPLFYVQAGAAFLLNTVHQRRVSGDRIPCFLPTLLSVFMWRKERLQVEHVARLSVFAGFYCSQGLLEYQTLLWWVLRSCIPNIVVARSIFPCTIQHWFKSFKLFTLYILAGLCLFVERWQLATLPIWSFERLQIFSQSNASGLFHHVFSLA